jgi:hypothetical protein
MTVSDVSQLNHKSFAMRVVRLGFPQGTTVERLFKKIGDSVSFGEPVAVLSSHLQITSPVVGHVVSINEKASGNNELAVFEGRKPLIEFRHLKNLVSSNTTASTPPTNSFSQPTASTQPTKLNSPSSLSFVDLPANYGRLPPLTSKETSLLHSGLASDVF